MEQIFNGVDIGNRQPRRQVFAYKKGGMSRSKGYVM